MNAHVDKSKEYKSKPVANAVSQKQSSSESTFQFMDNRPIVVAQRKLQDLISNSTRVSQLNALDSRHSSQQKSIQKKENNTGLPDNLKTGMENISGISLDGVKVHYNSKKPAQLNAHAFAQGNQIHLGAGQEKHLPHEAWHVVQQKQGRVKPTMSFNGQAINDNTSLEKEADVMGAQSLR